MHHELSISLFSCFALFCWINDRFVERQQSFDSLSQRFSGVPAGDYDYDEADYDGMDKVLIVPEFVTTAQTILFNKGDTII